jgi:uncharacterized protein
VFRPRRTRLAQPGRYGAGWGSGTTGFILGNILANAAHQHDNDRWRGGGGFSGGFSDGGGGGFSGGGGGSFDGGGASGDW